MFKRTAMTLVLLASGAVAALAAPAKATVVSVQEKSVVLKVEGEKGAWIKKGTLVKINSKFSGKITEVSDSTVTITTTKAGEMKAGDSVAFDKIVATSGC